MGKPLKRKDSKQDDKQRKISSFFENKAADKKEVSNLFTSITNIRTDNTSNSTTGVGQKLSLASSGSSKSLRTHRPLSSTSSNDDKLETTNSVSKSTKSNGRDSAPQKNNSDNLNDVVCIVDDSENEDWVEKHNGNGNAKDVSFQTSVMKNTEKQEITKEELLDRTDNKDRQVKENTEIQKGRKLTESASGTDTVISDENEIQLDNELSSIVTPLKAAVNEISSSPDVICNTPGADLSIRDGTKFKGRPGSRSFLRSFHLVSVQPGLKPAHMQTNAKKKSNRSLGPVSVSFNPQTEPNPVLDKDDNESCSEKSESNMENELFENVTDMSGAYRNDRPEDERRDIDHNEVPFSKVLNKNSEDKKIENQFVGLLSKTRGEFDGDGSMIKQNENSDHKFTEGNESYLKDNHSLQGLSIEEEEEETTGKETIETTKPTPTKIYNDSDIADLMRIKRQAKPGLSPLSKRQICEPMTVRENAVEKVKRNFNSDSEMKLLGANIHCANNSSSTHCKSKKFTVKKAEELGWKGRRSTETKTDIATLEDDDLLEELMKGLQPSIDGGPNLSASKLRKSGKNPVKSGVGSNTLDRSKASGQNDDLLRMFGMDLLEETDQPKNNVQSSDGEFVKLSNRELDGVTSRSKNSSVSSSVSNPWSETTSKPTNCKPMKVDCEEKTSHQVLTANIECDNDDNPPKQSSGSCDEREKESSEDLDDSMMLALDIEMEAITNQVEGEKLAHSFSALSPFKTPIGVPEKSSTTSKREFRFTDRWQRLNVKEVIYDSNADETYLTLCDGRDQTTRYCTLRGFWVDSKISEGDVVNIIGQFDDNNSCVLDDKSGLIVISPDFLLSGTSVVSSVFCARKSVLNEKFKGLDQGNVQMLYGSVIHSLFQTVVKEDIRQKAEVLKVARTLLSSPKFLHAMYSQGVPETAIMEEIQEYIPPLMTWMDKHLQTKDQRFGRNKSKSGVLVTGIQDIEENIWSPRFGLKGKIDLTVKAELQDRNGARQEKIVPLELKTGKASFSSEHKGQVTLYSMMYGDRRDDPGEGMLLYLKHGQMDMVQVKPQSQSGLIQLRNNLARYFKNQVSRHVDSAGQLSYSLGHLPEPISNQKACVKCSHLINCCIYQRSIESPSLSQSHPMHQLVPETLSHLVPEDLEYFTHWLTGLQMEEQYASQRQAGHIWTMGSVERESKGDCLSHLVVESSELGIQESQGFNEGKGCSLTFVRHHGKQGTQGVPLNSVGFSVNDSVVVSSEDGHLIALATGFVRSLSAKHVEVVVDRDNLFDISTYKDIIFRLDRNTSFSTSGQLMANLTRLMENSSHASRLRDLIVRKRQPQSEMKIPMSWVRTMRPVFKELNKPQKTAILKVLMASDYTLIRGFPGSGKTSTIVALVKVLHLLNKSVLLTSYTHSAVDNILLKLKQDNIPFLRLGRQARIHPTIRPHSAEILTSNLPTLEKLTEFYGSYNVIATSCLGVTHPLFSHRRFDVCIVDEASQVLQPACLGPLFYCQKFVLVGDARQLAPVVQSKEAKSLGLDESIFLRLEETGSTFDLHLQYRMNRVIMDISNKLVYGGRLECGNNEVAKQTLHVDPFKLEECSDWMRDALNPQLSKSVVFLDTQMISNLDTSDGPGIQSNLEANIVIVLLETLSKTNVNTKDIGVMSPYRSQVKLLQRRIQSCPLVSDVEVNTIDQYQGRDKSVILVTFAWSSDMNNGDSAGELLKDLRRLNVAVTRAKHKLILVGCSKVLKTCPHLETIITDLQNNKCVIELPSCPLPAQCLAPV